MNKNFLALIALILLAVTSAVSAKNKEPLGLIGKIQSINGNPYGIDVKENVVYLGEFSEGSLNFQTYNISNPKAPVRIGETETSQQMDELVVRGNRAYIANDALGLSIFDVSNPRNPFVLGQRSDGSYADTVALASLPSSCPNCAFVGYFYTGLLKIYDVSNPVSIPDPVGYESSIPNARHVIDVAVAGSRAYIWVLNDDENNWIEVLDLRNFPAQPSHLGDISLPKVTYGDWGNLAVSGRYVYLGTSVLQSTGTPTPTPGGLRVLDVSDPAKPRLVGSLDIPDIGNIPWQGAGLTISESHRRTFAYMVGTTALHIIDVSHPAKPTEIASYALPAEFGHMEGGFTVVRDGLAYVAATRGDLPSDGHGGLAIYRVAKKGDLPSHHVEHGFKH